ncbi:MAG: hypothetical protein QOG13_1844 [Sphingomonadales bacterium]|jgi:hypothetical protein|nr:hypothetical protein [Sphingomonadales bacterium]MEA3045476.1 hypothetical protein [Sphingomonadales bacterium]
MMTFSLGLIFIGVVLMVGGWFMMRDADRQ